MDCKQLSDDMHRLKRFFTLKMLVLKLNLKLTRPTTRCMPSHEEQLYA